MANTTGKKYGGRKKGTPNKTTTEIRERFQTLLDDNLETIQKDLQELEPRERIKALLELARFVVPTLKATELKATGNNFEPIVIEIVNPETDED